MCPESQDYLYEKTVLTKKLLNIGILSSLMIITIQMTGGFIELFQLNNEYIVLILNILNSLFNVILYTVLWRILVKHYKQSQLDWVIKSLILTLILTTSLSVIFEIKMIKAILIFTTALAVINLILYVVFLNKIMDIEKFEIKQIGYLKNYSLAFIICFLGQFVLSIFIELKNKDLKYINHFLPMIPIVFIVLFFIRIKSVRA